MANLIQGLKIKSDEVVEKSEPMKSENAKGCCHESPKVIVESCDGASGEKEEKDEKE